MKRPIFILRFGKTSVLPIDVETLANFDQERGDVMLHPVPMGLLILVTTDMSPEGVINLYGEIAEGLGDIAPAIAWRADEESDSVNNNIGKYIHHVDAMKEEWEKCFGKKMAGQKEKIEICFMSLDDLLDKVSRTGMDSLTDAEVTRLKSFSK